MSSVSLLEDKKLLYSGPFTLREVASILAFNTNGKHSHSCTKCRLGLVKPHLMKQSIFMVYFSMKIWLVFDAAKP